jgi:hypothetical protein
MTKSPPSPRQGQIWELTDTCDAHIQYLFTAPITFSGTVNLTAGEQVSITADATAPQSAVVNFQPVRYAELHDRLVPADIRNTPRYLKYLLSVPAEYFRAHFKLIKDVT